MGDYMTWLIVISLTIAIGSVCLVILGLLVLFFRGFFR